MPKVMYIKGWHFKWNHKSVGYQEKEISLQGEAGRFLSTLLRIKDVTHIIHSQVFRMDDGTEERSLLGEYHLG